MFHKMFFTDKYPHYNQNGYLNDKVLCFRQVKRVGMNLSISKDRTSLKPNSQPLNIFSPDFDETVN